MYAGKATLSMKEWISSRTLLLSLTLDEELTFVPGQFFTFIFQGAERKIPRSYSILRVEGKELILCIKLVDGGVASERFEKAEVGKEFTLRGPFGQFIYEEDENEKVMFIATDTGIVPFHAMIQEGTVLNKDTTLLFGSRNTEEIYFKEIYEDLHRKNKLTFLPTLTRQNWDGLIGRVQMHLPEDVNNTTFYICGRKEMVQEVTAILKERGAQDTNIKIERYD
jgi:NAD(P)H-flavin reductase